MPNNPRHCQGRQALDPARRTATLPKTSARLVCGATEREPVGGDNRERALRTSPICRATVLPAFPERPLLAWNRPARSEPDHLPPDTSTLSLLECVALGPIAKRAAGTLRELENDPNDMGKVV
jgi:hypothetical protein